MFISHELNSKKKKNNNKWKFLKVSKIFFKDKKKKMIHRMLQY